MNKNIYSQVDGTIVLSDAHAKVLKEVDRYEGPDLLVGANGIDVEEFRALHGASESLRDQYKVIYVSSPDRGLDYLLDMWKKDVRRSVPKASLDIYYDWSGFEHRFNKDLSFRKTLRPSQYPDALRSMIDDLDGVTLVGGVDHRTLHDAMYNASIWAYPTDFYETFCISAAKCQAAGCWPVVFSYGALKETVQHGIRLDTQNLVWSNRLPTYLLDTFCSMLINELLYPPTFEERKIMSDWARVKFDWRNTAKIFKSFL